MYLLVLAGALLLLGQFILPTTAGPYLEEGGESLFVNYRTILMWMFLKNSR
jgi:hypothetical protein